MEEVAKILKNELELLKTELIKEYDILGMRASGKWADALEVQTTETSGKILGLNYSEQLEFGRRAGKAPPRQAIEQWIRDKGLASRIEGQISVSTLAFLIARKIAREGWKREGFGGVELISKVVTAERIQKILDKVGFEYRLEFQSSIIKELKQLELA
jgi:hypothetical protein